MASSSTLSASALAAFAIGLPAFVFPPTVAPDLVDAVRCSLDLEDAISCP
jgi:hypothetical protein